jgi:hypothetical protein
VLTILHLFADIHRCLLKYSMTILYENETKIPFMYLLNIEMHTVLMK